MAPRFPFLANQNSEKNKYFSSWDNETYPEHRLSELDMPPLPSAIHFVFHCRNFNPSKSECVFFFFTGMTVSFMKPGVHMKNRKTLVWKILVGET